MSAGTFALVGGGEWNDGCRDFDAVLFGASGGDDVLVLPTAAAFEHADRVGERAVAYFESMGARAKVIPVLHRSEAEDAQTAKEVRAARFVYVSDGSPLHLRSVLKDSALFDALLASYHGGGVLAASGAGATTLCDPMVDPRGGAYTVGLGVVRNLAVFPYHGTAADHLRERSIDLLPRARPWSASTTRRRSCSHRTARGRPAAPGSSPSTGPTPRCRTATVTPSPASPPELVP